MDNVITAFTVSESRAKIYYWNSTRDVVAVLVLEEEDVAACASGTGSAVSGA
jgi:hypothetical protein